MRVLSIGNSFSQDAQTFLEALCPSVTARNLYVGGCSLEHHIEMLRAGMPYAQYEQWGMPLVRDGVTLADALKETWDVITVQQVSSMSGDYATYDPWLGELLGYVRAHSAAKIYFHRTWAYERTHNFPAWVTGEDPQADMHRRIVEASTAAAEKYGLGIIDAGGAIAAARAYAEYDVARGGLSLCRDGFHLSEDGRMLVGAVWAKKLTGQIPALFTRTPASRKEEIFAQVLRASQ